MYNVANTGAAMIRKIKITNFKSIKSDEITLPKFAAIIGKNSSGKTNFLTAIRLIKHLASGETIETILSKIAPIRDEIFYFWEDKKSADFELAVETKSKELFKLAFSISKNWDNDKNDILISRESLCQLVKEEGVTKEKFIYKRTPKGVLDHNNNSVPLTISNNKLALANYSNQEALKIASLISDFVVLEAEYERKQGQHIVSEDKIDTNILDDLIVSVYNKSRTDFESAVAVVKQLIPEFEKPRVLELSKFFEEEEKSGDEPKKKDTPESYIVRWSEKGFSGGYSSTTLSSGNLKTIFIIFTIFNSREKTFVAMEEIENGMHYARIEGLVDQLKTQSSNRKVQTIFTTHSSIILKSLSPKEVIHCERTLQQGTILRPLTAMDEYDAIVSSLEEDIQNAAEVIDSGLFD